MQHIIKYGEEALVLFATDHMCYTVFNPIGSLCSRFE